MKPCALFLLALSTLSLAGSRRDIIFLKSGRVVEGTILETNAIGFVFQLKSDNQRYQVASPDILGTISSNSDVIILKDGSNLQGQALSSKDGAIQFIPLGQSSAQEIPHSKVSHLFANSVTFDPSNVTLSESSRNISSVSRTDATTSLEPGKLTLGPTVGFNLSNFSVSNGTTTTTTGNRYGYVFGLAGEYTLTENLFLDPQVYYAQYGNSVTSATTVTTTKYDVVEVPLYLKYKIMPGSKLRPFAFAGPAFGYRLSSSIYDGTTTTDTSTLTSKYLFSAHFGAGIEFPLSEAILFDLSGCYMMGLNNLDATGTTAEMKQKTLKAFSSLRFAF